MNKDYFKVYQNYPSNNYLRNDFEDLLEGLKSAFAGEKEDELFYNELINKSPSSEARDIITSIRNDERRHNQIFRDMYFELSHINPVVNNEVGEIKRVTSFCEGLKRALKGEINAAREYSDLLSKVNNPKHELTITQIIIDELRHASLYNYLITQYC